MSDRIKRVFKVLLQGVIWIFVLSIQIEGRPIFYYLNDIMVKNSVVKGVDRELGDLWYRVSETARLTFSKPIERTTEQAM